uniref:Rap-GAP domain-containing protein n=1 Tax=Timema tahoe TaxID=61484 RepID=A0A7R9IL99_9NEOP|nr:unnamed protein product [Timema tahoe]
MAARLLIPLGSLIALTRLPKVFASFVGDQYMSVFAISLPYTNPFKYNHYTVSLAHHVIAVWFLKCRLPFRRDFVKFITTGLKANVIVPFEEGQLIMKSDLINEDSSSRKRSSSLTEQGSRRSLRTVGIRPEGRPGDLKPPIDEALMNFHMELTETCIDLMARYTFSTCSAQPKRLPTAEFLLSGGQSMTWILGNRVITVTTSGCSQKVLKNGLCDKCWMLCRPDKGCCVVLTKVRLCDKCSMLCRPDKGETLINVSLESLSPDVSADQEPQPGKQLHKSTNQRPVSNDVGSGSKDSRSFVTPDSSIISAPVEDKGKTLAAPDTHEPEPHRLEQIVFGPNEPEKQERQFCACWCQGWAEIHIRRPTGKKEDLMSSHKRINSETLAESEYDAILDQHFEHTPDDVEGTSHVLGINTGPSGPILIPGSPLKRSISRQNSRESLDNETDCYETDGRSRNPVRRSNSSPEMSASWKNPFMNRDKEREGKPLPLPLDRDDSGEMETKQETPTEAKKPAKLSKDPRVSCEAIPEESAGQGTTPPQPSTLVSGTTKQDGHPPLASCHSYPGTLEDEPERAPVSSHTVPPSPTSVTSPASVLSTPTSSVIHTGVFNTRSVQPLALQQRLPQTKELKSSPDTPRLSVSRQHVTSSTTPTTTSQLTINTSSASADKLSIKDEPHRPDPSALPPLAFKRGRGHTISVMSPIRKPPRLDWSNASKENSPRNKDTPRSGISPSFIFLQLYHAAHFGNISDKPLLLSQSQVVQRALKNLDRIPPYETHKIGVLYVGVGQASQEADILNNQFGSLRYTEFLQLSQGETGSEMKFVRIVLAVTRRNRIRNEVCENCVSCHKEKQGSEMKFVRIVLAVTRRNRIRNELSQGETGSEMNFVRIVLAVTRRNRIRNEVCENCVSCHKGETGSEMKFVRIVLAVTRVNRIRDEVIRERVGEARPKWYGHVMRMEKERMPKKLLEIKYAGKRSQGRPRKRWEEQKTKSVQVRGEEWKKLKEKDGGILINQIEWKQAAGIVEVLGPLADATKEISGDSYPTSSMVIPILHCLKSHLNVFITSKKDGVLFARSLDKALKSRFSFYDSDPIFCPSMLCDPRFRGVLIDDMVAVNTLAIEVKKLSDKSSLEPNVRDEQPSCSSSSSGLWSSFDSIPNTTQPAIDNNSEVKEYLNEPRRLGTLISLKDADIFLGGLDRNGNDGKFAYVWQDDVMQVTFHVATLMPNKETDPSGNGKKLHIGNDFVTIVYNESGEDYNMQTVKGQFNYACVVIQPLEHNTNQVTVKTRDDLAEHIGHSEPKIISDQNLALLSRQLALHANIKRERAQIWRADLIGSGTFNSSRRSRSDRIVALLAIVGGADQIGSWHF